MIYKIISSIFSKIIRKKFKIFDGSKNRTAVKSKDGFWYIGDISDTADIAYGILRNGEIEPLIATLVRQHKGTFYDIGSNTGYFAVLSAMYNNTSYGFEANLNSFSTARETVLLNGFKNCHMFNVAVGDENKQVIIYGDGTGASLKKDFSNENRIQSRNVNQVRLDYFIKEQKLLPPTMMLVDVEGWEYPVLQGALDTLKTHSPIVCFECFDPKSPVYGLLASLGYKIKQLDRIMFLAEK